jgi:hypothetical protein
MLLKKKWNQRHTDVPILSTDPRQVYNELKNKLLDSCDKESCWLDVLDAGATPELKESFVPKAPAEWKKKPNAWLSSVDITRVMKQFEHAYKCFEFLGPTPIDFDTRLSDGKCVWDELCNFQLSEQIKRNKTKIGIIFNTDKNTGPGEHWISMFIHIPRNQQKVNVFFFDSVGDPAPKEIVTFKNRLQKQATTLGLSFSYDTSEGVGHQRGGTECGVYSLFFLAHMLEDTMTTQYLKTHILPDKYMEKFRKVYFRGGGGGVTPNPPI